MKSATRLGVRNCPNSCCLSKSSCDAGANGEGIYLFEMDTHSGELSNRKLVAKVPNPTWIVIHPSKKYLYAINEVNNYDGKTGSITAFSINPSTGDLALLNTVSSGAAGPAHMSLDATEDDVRYALDFQRRDKPFCAA